jgi:hypothetical protein
LPKWIWIPIVALFLAACTAPSGDTFYLISAAELDQMYRAGVRDYCVSDAGREMSEYLIRPGDGNLAAVELACKAYAEMLSRRRKGEAPKPLMPERAKEEPGSEL